MRTVTVFCILMALISPSFAQKNPTPSPRSGAGQVYKKEGGSSSDTQAAKDHRDAIKASIQKTQEITNIQRCVAPMCGGKGRR